MKRVTIFVLIFLMGVFFTGATTFGSSPPDKVVVGVDSPPLTMNPHGSDADSNLSVMANIYEGLVKRVGAKGEIKPALATKWKRIDPTTWRFWLRKGVKFHNGNPFTWEDVKFTFKHLRDPKVSDFLFFGNLVTSIETVNGNPWVIDITTKTPTPYFLNNLHQIFIIDKEYTEAHSTGEVAAKGMGTGPYKFVEWEKGAYLKLEANEDYWGEVPPIKYAVLRPITEPSTRLAALSTGKIDLMSGVPVELYNTIAQNPKLSVITRPSRRAIFLGISNEPELPTSDIRVRKAMYLAINEKEIIEKIMRGHATPAAQIPDPATFGYNPELKRLGYDPDRARQLLEEAGYGDGFEITLNVTLDRYVQDEQIGAAIVSYLNKIGIQAKLHAMPKALYWPKLQNKEVDFYMLGWFDGAYSFTRSAFKLLHCPDPEKGYGVWNGAGFCYPKVDQMLEDSTKILNRDKRLKAVQKVNKAYMEKIAVIPLHYQQHIYAMRKGIGLNFTPRPDRWIEFWEMSYGE